MKEKELFIFDVDGTLVNSYQAIAQSLNFTRIQLGYSVVSFKKAKLNIGGGDKNFIEIFFNSRDATKALNIYCNHHKESLLKSSRLMSNARRLLYTLKRRGKIITIVSNRPKYFTNILLDRLDIKKYFNSINCADEVKALKPSPKMLNTVLKRFNVKKDKAVYIGDMAIDLEAAKRARIDAVFVKGGSSTLAEIKKYKNKKVIKNLKTILELYN